MQLHCKFRFSALICVCSQLPRWRRGSLIAPVAQRKKSPTPPTDFVRSTSLTLPLWSLVIGVIDDKSLVLGRDLLYRRNVGRSSCAGTREIHRFYCRNGKRFLLLINPGGGKTNSLKIRVNQGFRAVADWRWGKFSGGLKNLTCVVKLRVLKRSMQMTRDSISARFCLRLRVRNRIHSRFVFEKGRF